MEIVNWMWSAWVTYWMISALRAKTAKKREPTGRRVLHLAIVIAGFALLFAPWLRIGWLGERFLPGTGLVRAIGVVLTAIGLAFTVWARVHLGANWSGSVTLKKGHELIRTGPYARLRHPIYTGLLLATTGTAIAVGEWCCLLGALLVLLAHIGKAKREEALLAVEFGESFQAHCRKTGFLMPRFH